MLVLLMCTFQNNNNTHAIFSLEFQLEFVIFLKTVLCVRAYTALLCVSVLP